MVQSRLPTYALAVTLLLQGCSGSIWPGGGDRSAGTEIDGETPNLATVQEGLPQSPPPQGAALASAPAAPASPGAVTQTAAASPQPLQTAPPATGAQADSTIAPLTLGTGNFRPVQTAQAAAAAAPASTGTFVGQKVDALRGELSQLQTSIGGRNGQLQEIRSQALANAQRYHQAVAAINTRLQVGTTPGNPELVTQWNQAQSDLSNIAESLSAMNQLSTEVAGDSALAAFLLENVRAAYGLSGAVEEDHRQLGLLEDEVNRTVVLIDRLLNEVSEDIERQTVYLSAEQRNMSTISLAIKNGELYGTSLANRAFTAINAPGANLSFAGPPGSGVSGGSAPLVIIRFDRPNVDYELALKNAIDQALQRRPNAEFDLVAVAPAQGTAAQVAINTSKAKTSAQQVLRTLAELGLAGRVALSSNTSQDAEVNEVHVYIR